MNLDCIIRAPILHQEELARFVHRPTLKCILYPETDFFNLPYSSNLVALQSVTKAMDIEDDPFVQSLRSQLSSLQYGDDEWIRVDQKLSKTIRKRDSYVHKGLTDFENAALAICSDVGPWAADWYIAKAVGHAQAAAEPFAPIFYSMKHRERDYLLDKIREVHSMLTPVSYEPDDVLAGASAKVESLVKSLLEEKNSTESYNEAFSGLVFVTRRDTGMQGPKPTGV
jgi:endoribonuclease Dicer